MPEIAFVNELFLPLADAKVSVEDRGFQFGDGVYELVRVYGGVPFRLHDHLTRLERSARAVGISEPFGTDRWSALIAEAIRQSGYAEAKVYIQITRGVSPRDHSFSATLVPTVIMTVRPLVPPAAELYRHGAPVVTVPDIRWGRCDIKSICLLANVMAKQQALNAGAFEAIFVRGGEVLEGATSNIMAIQDGTLITPPESPNLLAGVTRLVTLQLAREAGLTIREGAITETGVYAVDELFLTGTTIELLPVARINGRQIGAAAPGPRTADLMGRFRKLHA
jgi:D-alanine transaminase